MHGGRMQVVETIFDSYFSRKSQLVLINSTFLLHMQNNLAFWASEICLSCWPQGAILIGETDLEETFENLILNQVTIL